MTKPHKICEERGCKLKEVSSTYCEENGCELQRVIDAIYGESILLNRIKRA